MKDLGLAMRAAGCLVTEAEVKILAKRIDPYSTRYCKKNSDCRRIERFSQLYLSGVSKR